MAAAGDPAGGAGKHGAGGETRRIGDGRDPAMRLDDQDRPGEPARAQPRLEAQEIALQSGADVGVDDRGADPLVLLDLREDLGGEREIGVRQRRAHRLGGEPLVAAVAPGVQIADRDRLDLGAGQLGERRGERALIERRLDAAVGAHPLAHAEAALARHQRLGRRLAEVVAVVLEALAHLEHVAVALGRQQRGPGALALEQRVGGDGRAVDDGPGLLEQSAPLDAERGGKPLEPRHARPPTGRTASRPPWRC